MANIDVSIALVRRWSLILLLDILINVKAVDLDSCVHVYSIVLLIPSPYIRLSIWQDICQILDWIFPKIRMGIHGEGWEITSCPRMSDINTFLKKIIGQKCNGPSHCSSLQRWNAYCEETLAIIAMGINFGLLTLWEGEEGHEIIPAQGRSDLYTFL